MFKDSDTVVWPFLLLIVEDAVFKSKILLYFMNVDLMRKRIFVSKKFLQDVRMSRFLSTLCVHGGSTLANTQCCGSGRF
jgi:hypothetical protein